MERKNEMSNVTLNSATQTHDTLSTEKERNFDGLKAIHRRN